MGSLLVDEKQQTLNLHYLRPLFLHLVECYFVGVLVWMCIWPTSKEFKVFESLVSTFNHLFCLWKSSNICYWLQIEGCWILYLVVRILWSHLNTLKSNIEMKCKYTNEICVIYSSIISIRNINLVMLFWYLMLHVTLSGQTWYQSCHFILICNVIRDTIQNNLTSISRI